MGIAPIRWVKGLLKAACALVDAGSRKVNWLRGGIPGWKAKGYPIE